MHEGWHDIVRRGTSAARGMPGFEELDAGDAEAIRAYVVEQTHNAIALCQSEYRKNYPELLETACTRARVTRGK